MLDIVYLTSLRHPENSKDYVVVEKLLYNSLTALSNQLTSKSKAIIVCNKKPTFEFANIDFIEVNLPPPNNQKKPNSSIEELVSDRSLKNTIGIVYAKKYDPKYLMFFDYDDFIHKDLLASVENMDIDSGCHVHRGWIMDHKSKVCYEQDKFHYLCGTSNIIKFKLLYDPIDQGVVELEFAGKKISFDTARTSLKKLTIDSTKSEIISSVDQNYLKYILGAHRWPHIYFKTKPIEQPIAIWNRNNSQNLYEEFNVYGRNPKLVNLIPFGIRLSNKQKVHQALLYCFFKLGYICKKLRSLRIKRSTSVI